jgi:hypothetical protein
MDKIMKAGLRKQSTPLPEEKRLASALLGFTYLDPDSFHAALRVRGRSLPCCFADLDVQIRNLLGGGTPQGMRTNRPNGHVITAVTFETKHHWAKMLPARNPVRGTRMCGVTGSSPSPISMTLTGVSESATRRGFGWKSTRRKIQA